MTSLQFLEITDYLKTCIEGSEFEGHVFAVGGCMRDHLLNLPIKDIDICVDLPEGGIRFAEWLDSKKKTQDSIVIYPTFGTAMFRLKKFPFEEIEVVQTRKECYRDEESRNPETSFGTIDDDCQRRDFTYNAIYYDISAKEIKYFNENSKSDLENNILRTCGDPNIIFDEDPLRVMRAVRFACKYNSTIEPETYKGMKKHAERLEIISRERIQEEITKILTGPFNDRGIRMLYYIGALPYVFPTLAAHDWEIHSIELGLQLANTRDIAVNLAIIFWHCISPEQDLRYLKYSNTVINACLDIMDNSINGFLSHIVEDGLGSPKTIVNLRKFQYGCRSFENMIGHMTYLYSISPAYRDKKAQMMILKDKTIEMIQCASAMFGFKLPVDGDDVMMAKHIGPGKAVKEYLDLLMEIAFVNPNITKDECITFLKYM